MKTFAIVAIALFAVSALPLANAAEDYAAICTPPTPPVGACATVTYDPMNLRYREPHAGETWSYECDPYGLVCVLTPDVYYTSGYITVPWFYVGTTTWCHPCRDISTFSLA